MLRGFHIDLGCRNEQADERVGTRLDPHGSTRARTGLTAHGVGKEQPMLLEHRELRSSDGCFLDSANFWLQKPGDMMKYRLTEFPVSSYFLSTENV